MTEKANFVKQFVIKLLKCMRLCKRKKNKPDI